MTIENFHSKNGNETAKMDAAAFGVDMATRPQIGVIPKECFNSRALETAVKLPVYIAVVLGSDLTLGFGDDQLAKLMTWSENYLSNRQEKCARNYYMNKDASSAFY